MKPLSRIITALAAILLATPLAVSAQGQIYGKLNTAYALAGIINPQVEVVLSERMSFQTELVYSPWKYIVYRGVNRPMRFVIFSNETRMFLHHPTQGWYAGLNLGFQGFNMTKPDFSGGRIGLEEGHSGKGYGLQAGMSIGYQWTFTERWLLDAYAGFGYQISWYNSYYYNTPGIPNGTIEDVPHGHDPNAAHDPWNASAEWGPNKAGVSIGYRIFSPHPKHS